MTTYLKLTTTDGGGKRESLLIEVISEGPEFIHGHKVNKSAERVEGRYEDDTLIVTERLIQTTCIVTRTTLVMNNHYGRLEPVADKEGDDGNPPRASGGAPPS